MKFQPEQEKLLKEILHNQEVLTRKVDEVHMSVVGNTTLGVDGLVKRVNKIEIWKSNQQLQAAKIAGMVSSAVFLVGVAVKWLFGGGAK